MTITLSNVVASTPDDRDYIYVTRNGPFPDKCDLKPDVYEIEDQLSIGSCVANAFVGACEHLLKSHSTAQSLSRLFPYYNGRVKLENQTGEGMQPRDGAKALNHWGTPPESLYPYDITQENVEPGPDIYTAALPFMVTRYERIPTPAWGEVHTSDWAAQFELAVKSALSEGLPVVVATKVGEQIRHLTGPWQSHKMSPVDMPMRNNPGIGNHMTMLIGYDSTIQNPCPGMIQPGSWLDQNSWGTTYGDGGFFGFPFATMSEDVMEAYVVRGFADILINPVPQVPYITDPIEVLRRFHELWRMDVTDPMAASIQHYAYVNDPPPKNFPPIFWDDYERIVTAKLAEVRAAWAKDHPA